MSSPVIPFSQVLSSFDSQLATFDHLANNGFSTPSLTPVTALAPPTGSSGSSTGVLGAVTGAVGGAIFSSRVVAILLGLIAIAGAIFLFKEPDIVSTVKTVAATTAEA